MRVIDLFERAARAHPGRTCLVDGEARLTYEQVRLRVHGLARILCDHAGGVPGGVAVLAGNRASALIGVLAALRAGGVWIPANDRLPPAELGRFLRIADCRLLLADEAIMDGARAVADEAGCPVMAIGVDALDGEFGECGGFPEIEAADAVCSVFSTGGTTGAPKAAVWTHRTWTTLVANFHAGIHHRAAPVHLVAAPATHAAGVVALVMMAIGATTVLIDRAEPSAVLSAIERHRVTTLFLPPTAIYSLLAHPRLDDADLSSLENLIYAAAPMSVGKLKEAMARIGPVLVQTFGQAEAPMVCTILGRDEHVRALAAGDDARLASCGRPALFTDVGVLDDDGRECGPGKVGEIAVRGDLVMAGYMGSDDPPSDPDVWRRTGDLGQLDADGYLTITGRRREIIITGGFNVYPAAVEQVLWTHPAVKDCAVVGAPDEHWGEAVVGVVELKDGASCSPEELISLCKAQLDSIRAPKRIEFWPELPRSAVGKVLKREVRAAFWPAAAEGGRSI